jgi:hypothetical protein
LFIRRQPIRDPLFEGSIWLIGAAQVGEDAAEANFFEIRRRSRLRNFIAQFRMQQRQRDKADLGLRAGVAAAPARRGGRRIRGRARVARDPRRRRGPR